MAMSRGIKDWAVRSAAYGVQTNIAIYLSLFLNFDGDGRILHRSHIRSRIDPHIALDGHTFSERKGIRLIAHSAFHHQRDIRIG